MALSKKERGLLQKTLAEVHRLKGLPPDAGRLGESVMCEVARLSLPKAGIQRLAPAARNRRAPAAAVGFALVVICVAAALFMGRAHEKKKAEVCLKTSQDVVMAQLFFVD